MRECLENKSTKTQKKTLDRSDRSPQTGKNQKASYLDNSSSFNHIDLMKWFITMNAVKIEKS
jgi:hypothetical protein